MHAPWHIYTHTHTATDKITFLREVYCTFYETVVQQGLKGFQVNVVRTVVVGGECKRGASGVDGQSLLLVQTDGGILASNDDLDDSHFPAATVSGPGPATDTEVHGCSSLIKTVYYLHIAYLYQPRHITYLCKSVFMCVCADVPAYVCLCLYVCAGGCRHVL